MKKRLVSLLGGMSMLGLVTGCQNYSSLSTPDATQIIAENIVSLSNILEGDISYRMVVEGFDWGAGTTALIIDLGDQQVNSSMLDVNDFEVSVFRQNQGGTYEERTILSVYTSDAYGNESTTASSFITIELEVTPQSGNPFFFFFDAGVMGNMWADPYAHTITYRGTELSPVQTGRIMPLTDKFNLDGEFTGSDGVSIQYAYFQPQASESQPLIVWLHGAGEGSLDGTVGTEILLLGNRVTQLVAPEIQDILGGAYILTPQTGTRWLNSGDWAHVDGQSKYETALIELIETFIANNPNIDTDRVYIGGGSNGGFMALRVLFSRPDLIAASLPICIYFDPSAISEEEIAKVVDIPMWLVHDINDPTTPFEHTESLYNRLLAAGATNVHLTYTDGIYDTTGQFFDEEGNPHRFHDHWTWVPVLNNEVETEIDGQTITIFEWLAAQSR